MLAGPAQAFAAQRRNPINPICNDLINIDENNWFTNSYREKEAKFRNNLPNEGKSEVSRNCASSGLKPRLPTLTIRRWTSSEFAAAYRNLSRAMRLTPGPLRLVQFPVFGLPMLRISRCNCSPLALFTFKAPGSVAPSVTSTQRPPV